jgi:hypothetical protein
MRSTGDVSEEAQGGTITVHVRSGEQYRIFLRLVQRACFTCKIDDVLPELSDTDSRHRFYLIRDPSRIESNAQWQTGEPQPDMLVRRTMLRKPPHGHLVVNPRSENEKRALCALSSFSHVKSRAAANHVPLPNPS